ncbi:NAD(P)-binding domain-containing protein [Hoeflea sp. WL0058]|uniref:NAD(P)-binding domain-containing protein n=1 Tax=Flavimaribacter sediminis TaxID=2865987 RepID=A0AAE2ZLC4_9HYPH|nr:NAD(P)-binding domain-containing protein [Flavimaribacter sediminis]MBW8638944.1 NAD(P)-binding domain-containing protein [Flavimaribacter sediminis]
MTNIAILGSGRVASAIATRLAASGQNFVVGIVDPEKPSDRWSGPNTEFKSTSEAIAASDIIFNATPGETSVAFLSPLQSELAGKVLVDVSNAMRRDEAGMPVGLLYPDSSVAEHLQAALPDTAVVKTLNTMLFAVMANPECLSPMATVFLSGNETSAKEHVHALLRTMGWQEEVIEDLGPIASARGPESFMHFVPHIIAKHGFAPFALSIAR